MFSDLNLFMKFEVDIYKKKGDALQINLALANVNVIIFVFHCARETDLIIKKIKKII